VATISGEGITTETRSYKTFSSSLTELKEWLIASGVTHVAMESTGVPGTGFSGTNRRVESIIN